MWIDDYAKDGGEELFTKMHLGKKFLAAIFILVKSSSPPSLA